MRRPSAPRRSIKRTARSERTRRRCGCTTTRTAAGSRRPFRSTRRRSAPTASGIEIRRPVLLGLPRVTERLARRDCCIGAEHYAYVISCSAPLKLLNVLAWLGRRCNGLEFEVTDIRSECATKVRSLIQAFFGAGEQVNTCTCTSTCMAAAVWGRPSVAGNRGYVSSRHPPARPRGEGICSRALCWLRCA